MSFGYVNLIWLCAKLIGMILGCVRKVWLSAKFLILIWVFANFMLLIAPCVFNTYKYDINVMYFVSFMSKMYVKLCAINSTTIVTFLTLFSLLLHWYYNSITKNLVIVLISEIDVRRVWSVPWE